MTFPKKRKKKYLCTNHLFTSFSHGTRTSPPSSCPNLRPDDGPEFYPRDRAQPGLCAGRSRSRFVARVVGTALGCRAQPQRRLFAAAGSAGFPDDAHPAFAEIHLRLQADDDPRLAGQCPVAVCGRSRHPVVERGKDPASVPRSGRCGGMGGRYRDIGQCIYSLSVFQGKRPRPECQGSLPAYGC